jgi:hypothetical protein
MSGPIPCLGYRSRTQAAIALRERGLTHSQIAARIGVAAPAVGGLIANGKLARPIARSGATWVRAMLGSDTVATLQRAAEQRGTSIALLAARILTQAARDGLIDAILDDGGLP